MSVTWIEIAGAIFTFGSSLAINAVIVGRYAQKVDGFERKTDDHDTRIRKLEIAFAASTGKVNGINYREE